MTARLAAVFLIGAVSSAAWAQEQREETKPVPHLWCETHDDDFYTRSCRFGGRLAVTKRDVQAQLRLVNYEAGEWSVGMHDFFIGPAVTMDGKHGGVVTGVSGDMNVFLAGLHAGFGAVARQDVRPELQMELGLRLLFVLEIGFRGIIGADVGHTGMLYGALSI